MFNEREVVASILAGDVQAFERMVNEYQRLVYHVIDRLVKDGMDREDICQEVFIKVYRNLRSFQYRSKLSTWVASIAYRTALNYTRDNKRVGQISLDDYEGAGEQDDPERIFTNKDTAGYLRRLIEELPLPYKSVLVLYHINEFSYPEIGQITGMPEGTVKSHLFRARKFLKDKLKSQYKDEYVKRPG